MRARILTFAFALLVAGCGDDPVVGPDEEDVIGSWQAVEFEFSRDDETWDVLAIDGYFNLLVRSNGSAHVETSIPHPETDALDLYWSFEGSWSIRGSRIELDAIPWEEEDVDERLEYEDGQIVLRLDVGESSAIAVLERVPQPASAE